MAEKIKIRRKKRAGIIKQADLTTEEFIKLL